MFNPSNQDNKHIFLIYFIIGIINLNCVLLNIYLTIFKCTCLIPKNFCESCKNQYLLLLNILKVIINK